MIAIRYILTIALVAALFTTGFTQVKKGETFEFAAVYDSIYGITVYEPLNMNTGGDSTRNSVKGYAQQGWIADYYPSGEMLHKGYYIDGQLKAYKNFFPNGQVEREFKMINLQKSGLNIYYDNGQEKSVILYQTMNAIKEEDYFKTGQLEYIEEYDKDCVYYLQRKFYTKTGQPTSTLEIIDNRKKIYDSKEYYDNGKLKEEGQVVFNEGMGDYQKNGKWKFYNEDGSLKEEKTFSRGGDESD